MIAIACVDKNFGIGKDNKLLIKIPDDMAYFKNNTLNSIVIMGRKTLFSFKDKKPLANRINIVFTHDKKLKNFYSDFDNQDNTKIFFVDNKKDALNLISKYNDKNCFVIGGESIYNLFLDDYTKILLTEVDTVFNADSFFPNFDKKKFIKTSSDTKYYNSISYKFSVYKKIRVD